jgi:cyclase
MTFGFGQTPGDLYVWDPSAKTLWTGNVIVCPEPGIPWLLDGRHAEVLSTLKKIRDFLPDDAIIVPGHYKPIRKGEIDFSINYLQALHDGVKKGIEQHQTLDQIVTSLKMEEFNKGYPIWNWLQFQVNIPNTYKDLKTGKKQ